MKSAPDLREAETDRMLRALSDPVRRRILRGLAQRDTKSPGQPRKMCGGDVERHVGLSQPTVSHHMAVLRRAGLVEAHKVGQSVWYQRNERALQQLARTVRNDL